MIGQHTQKHCVTEPGNGKRSEPEGSMLQEPPNKTMEPPPFAAVPLHGAAHR